MRTTKKVKQSYDDIDLQHYYRGTPVNILLLILKNIGIVIGITTVATFIAFGFRQLGFFEANYILTYTLGVFLIANLTDGYIYGIIASILGVSVYNYFFTVPYYTFLAYSPEYPVTFFVMLVVSFITSTLTGKVRRESKLAEIREKRIRILYQIEKDLLSVKSKHQVLEIAAKDINNIFGTPAIICAADIKGELTLSYVQGENCFNNETEIKAQHETFQAGISCGKNTQLFSNSNAYYFPISGQSGVLGVIGIAFNNEIKLSESRKLFLETIGAQIALALEREQLYEKQQKTRMEMVQERLRGDLLRAVSHDLRTPLTGILGSTSTVLENYDTLTDCVKKEFLNGIYDEAQWLNNLVENILSVTRFSQGDIKLKKEMEAVEEIVAEAVSLVKKRTGRRDISISIPEELVMIPVDGMLIEQVLVNLLNNAIKHTPENSNVSVSVVLSEDDVIFEVSDDGKGIPEDEIPFIFNRYYKTSTDENKNGRGFALGLTICKSIIQAHGGNISVENKQSGGVTFRFSLPIKE